MCYNIAKLFGIFPTTIQLITLLSLVPCYLLQDVTELICHLLTHLRVNFDKQNITKWFSDYVSDPSSWIDWWTFFAVASEKCLGPRGGQATTKAIQQLYEEVVEEVINCLYVCITQCRVQHTDAEYNS